MVVKASEASLQSTAKPAASHLRLTCNEAGPTPPVWIEINLPAIQHNLRQIRRHLAPSVKILAVIKANAYGHGLLPVAQALRQAGADFLGVASVVEALALRRAGIGGKILVLGQCLPEEASSVVKHELIQAIGDGSSAEALAEAACRQGKPASVHLKVDTGMGRYGVWHEEAFTLYRRLLELTPLKAEGIFTHLSMAGQNVEATEEQLLRFSKLLQRLERAKLPVGIRHAANSVGLLRFPGCHLDLVRTGLLIYGASPIKEGQPLKLKPALALKSRVRFLKMIEPGRTVSYGGTYQASRKTLVATVPIGYAHGYTRALSNKAEILVRGVRVPVIGRITMEDLMCDVTSVPGVAVGQEVVAIGRQGNEWLTAEELAQHARTIPYEILVGLSPAIPRRYIQTPV